MLVCSNCGASYASGGFGGPVVCPRCGTPYSDKLIQESLYSGLGATNAGYTDLRKRLIELLDLPETASDTDILAAAKSQIVHKTKMP